MRLEVGAVAAVAAGVAVAAYIRRLRAELAAARRDNDVFVAAAVRGTLAAAGAAAAGAAAAGAAGAGRLGAGAAAARQRE